MRRIGEAVEFCSVHAANPSPLNIVREPRRAGLAAAAARHDRPRRLRFVGGYLLSFDCPMISAALKLMLQVGKELPTKKLSPSFE